MAPGFAALDRQLHLLVDIIEWCVGPGARWVEIQHALKPHGERQIDRALRYLKDKGLLSCEGGMYSATREGRRFLGACYVLFREG